MPVTAGDGGGLCSRSRSFLLRRIARELRGRRRSLMQYQRSKHPDGLEDMIERGLNDEFIVLFIIQRHARNNCIT
jgi:hypothetical protein